MPLVLLEWAAIFSGLTLEASNLVPAPTAVTWTLCITLILLLVGYRGMVSGHVRRLGGLILFWQNLFLFSLLTASLVTAWFQYR